MEKPGVFVKPVAKTLVKTTLVVGARARVLVPAYPQSSHLNDMIQESASMIPKGENMS